MAKIRSNSIGVYISDSSTPNTDPLSGATFGDQAAESDTFALIAAATSGSFSGSLEVIDATTKDNDGQREILPGGLTWSMSVEGMIETGLASTVKSNVDLFDLWKAKTLIRLAWTGGTDGDVMYYGNAYITTLEESAGLNEVATFSATFEGDGDIVKAIVDDTNATWNNNDD